MRIVIYLILLSSLVLSSCIASPSSAPILVPTVSQTSSPTRANVPSTTAAITARPTINNKTIVITPDNLLSFPELIEWSTPDSGDFCEQLPSPQIASNPNRLSFLSGRFVLCIYERIFTAMDLDAGSLVSTDDEKGDVVLGSPGGGENPTYGAFGWNNASVKNAYVLEAYANHSGANHLSYEYCEDRLENGTDQGAMYIGQQFLGNIACVRTTEGKIALIRVERIYPAATLSVEFSFVVLKNE